MHLRCCIVLKNAYMSHEHPQRRPDPLERNSALRNTVSEWCSSDGEEKGPMTFDEVVSTIGKDQMLLDGIREYLSPGGAGYEADREVADHFRERLAWALVDHFTDRD